MTDTAAVAEPGGGMTDGLVGMLNVFVDPAETARRVPSKLSWLWPVIVIAIAYITISSLMVPYAMQLVDAKMAEREAVQLLRGKAPQHTSVPSFATTLDRI